MNEQQLAGIEARNAARTPGVWTWEDDSCLDPGMVTVYAGRTDEFHGLNLFGRLYPDRNGKANLDFVAASSEDVPALCVTLRQAWADNAYLAAEVARLRGLLDSPAEY